jgi:hypothetical protein
VTLFSEPEDIEAGLIPLQQDKFISLTSGITSRQKSSRAKPNGLTVLQAVTAVFLFPKSNFSLYQFIRTRTALPEYFLLAFFTLMAA